MGATNTDDVIAGMWDMLKNDIRGVWSEITAEDIRAINGSAISVSETLQSKFLLTREKAEKLVDRLANKYDLMAGVSRDDMLTKASQFWTDLTADDLASICTRRSSLVSAVENRYAVPRDMAWRQVNAFLNAMRPNSKSASQIRAL